MTNKFKAALAATSLAGAIIATGAEVDVNGFEIDVTLNDAVAAIVSEAAATAKPVEPAIILALSMGNDRGGRGGRGDGNIGRESRGDEGGGSY